MDPGNMVLVHINLSVKDLLAQKYLGRRLFHSRRVAVDSAHHGFDTALPRR